MLRRPFRGVASRRNSSSSNLAARFVFHHSTILSMLISIRQCNQIANSIHTLYSRSIIWKYLACPIFWSNIFDTSRKTCRFSNTEFCFRHQSLNQHLFSTENEKVRTCSFKKNFSRCAWMTLFFFSLRLTHFEIC